MSGFLSKLPQDVRAKIREAIGRHGVNYSDLINEIWHLVGNYCPVYTPRQVGPQFEMQLTWQTKYGTFTSTGLGHNKKAARRETAGAMLLKLELIKEVEPKVSHLRGAAQRQRYVQKPKPVHKPTPRWRQMAS